MSINVVLVACYGSMQPSNAEPLAIECLAGALHYKFGNKIRVYQYTLSEDDDPLGIELCSKILKTCKVDILGVSIPQSCYILSCDFITRFTKDSLDNVQVILGHALPTHNPSMFLSKFPKAIIIKGWGEEAICEIVERKIKNTQGWEKIPNAAFLVGDSLVTTSGTSPTPTYSPIRQYDLDYFPRIESSRGCHYDICTFCTRPYQGKVSKKWFRFPIEKTINEIKALSIKDNIAETNFTFTDEDFIGDDLDGAETLANELLKIGKINFSIAVRVDNVFNPNETLGQHIRRIKIFQKLKQAGLSLVYFGAESFSNTQLRRYGKGIKVADSVKSINSILDLGIPVELGCILFDPLLSVDEFIENIAWLEKTALWLHVGQLFNNLRVQKDSGFETILKNKNLLGEFQPNTMEFKYQFTNPIINDIANHCVNWKDEVDDIYSLARNVQRTNFGNSSSAIFVKEYRRLEFQILKSISIALNKSANVFFMADDHYKRRVKLISNLHKRLSEQNYLQRSENALLFACKNFLSENIKNSEFASN